VLRSTAALPSSKHGAVNSPAEIWRLRCALKWQKSREPDPQGVWEAKVPEERSAAETAPQPHRRGRVGDLGPTCRPIAAHAGAALGAILVFLARKAVQPACFSASTEKRAELDRRETGPNPREEDLKQAAASPVQSVLQRHLAREGKTANLRADDEVHRQQCASTVWQV